MTDLPRNERAGLPFVPGEAVRPGMTVPAEIVGIAADGRGTALVSGRQLLVRGALPGDEVDARVFRRRGGRLEGYAVDVRKEGYERRKPPCEYVGQCGGCMWQQWPLDTQHAMKQRIVREAFSRALPNASVEVCSVLHVGPAFGYRNKMEFTFGQNVDGELTLGLHRVGRFDVTLDIERCWLAPEGMNAVRLWVRDWARRNNLNPYNARRFSGALRHLVLRESAATGDIMANLVSTTEDVGGLEELGSGLPAAFPSVKSVLFSINTRRGDTARPETSEQLFGSPTISERIGDLDVAVSLTSFLQTNSVGAVGLYTTVRELAHLAGGERVLDMYSGIGLIGLALAGDAGEVVGVEAVPSAVRDAEELRARLGLGHVRFVEGEAERLIPAWADAGERFDLVIVDPPRAGLHPKALEALVRIAPKAIIYVSCNPVTLAANAREIIAAGYRMGEVRPVDLFPHTPHVESVVRFDR